MSKIIKVSTDLEVTVHDYPEGMLETQNRQLCELIGDGCDMVENVMPKRLYRELGNILFVGNAYIGDGVEFTGIEPETFETLHKQLRNMAMAMKAHKEALGV